MLHEICTWGILSITGKAGDLFSNFCKKNSAMDAVL